MRISELKIKISENYPHSVIFNLQSEPGCFMNCCRETVEMAVPPGNRRGGWIGDVLEQYVAGSDTRGRPEGQSYPRSQQAIHETSGLNISNLKYSSLTASRTLCGPVQ